LETANWTDIAAEIRRLLDAYAAHLSLEARQGVEHYLSHDEYEMAFEGLGLELIKVDEVTLEDRRCCTWLARQLGLNTESVFDANFWQKLSQFEASGGEN
jgi:hypothetical protein